MDQNRYAACKYLDILQTRVLQGNLDHRHAGLDIYYIISYAYTNTPRTVFFRDTFRTRVEGDGY